ncbi:MAG TPA: hypothetical protein PLL30_14580 [Candidatus Krumholzibacteria bacterium]|nr:hypothetical protein [Candidatus Krumholzibacteria bacterium]HPD72993.1 hypothetical protein [Candidatus Krumholzibacteria bacterium]HRY41792.1 hypothetical protein [Candidatus Krumholzibacteria bacterium]
MARTAERRFPFRRPAVATTVGAALTAAGILLGTLVDMGFLVLAAFGTFGPGILRELGWLHDQDEFRRQAAWRAGYHAYLAGGSAAVVVISALKRGTANLDGLALPVALLLSVLWLTWLFSALLAYWGAQRAASTTLLVFGTFWLLFSVADSWQQPLGMLMHSLPALCFFALAWLAHRLPRLAGSLLLAAGAAAIWAFRLDRAFALQDLSKAMVLVLFVGPLVAGGIALLRARPASDETA